MTKQPEGIWIYLEQIQGQVHPVGLQLLNQGKYLAQKNGQRLTAIIIGDQVEDAIAKAQIHGAEQIMVVQGHQYHDYDTLTYTYALTWLAQHHQPSAILIGATAQGRDLAPRLSCRLKTGLSADCAMVDVDAADRQTIIWTRPALGGHLMANILCRTYPQMGTIRPHIFQEGKTDQHFRSNIVKHTLVPPPRSTSLLSHTIDEYACQLDQADIIIAGGLGMVNQQNFSLLEQLAQTIGGTVGATKAAVDAGFASYSQQIGQSGKTVSPKLYIAFGISGATHHLSGLTSAQAIIAINKDPQAPIFQVAHYGLVGDAITLLPMLIAKLQEH